MKVRDEINKYASEAEKPILLWLFDRWHMESEWHMMASCTFDGRYPASKRIWHPSAVGLKLYQYEKMREALEFYADKENWKEEESGIGTPPGPAVDYGHMAIEALKTP
jgi:hypothetical protein